jgi:hypothetical protein
MIMLKVTYKSGDPEWFTNKIRKKKKKIAAHDGWLHLERISAQRKVNGYQKGSLQLC